MEYLGSATLSPRPTDEHIDEGSIGRANGRAVG